MTAPAKPPTSRLENGDVMSREEFHRRYSAHEELQRVELIEGVVYLPSPIRVQGHAAEQSLVFAWLDSYAATRDGIVARTPASVLLDDQNEPEPDVMLYREGADSYRDGYLAKAPELIVEIAASSVSRDLHQKKRAYERNAVLEYIVWRTVDGAIDWFSLVEGAYVTVAPDAAGLIQSAVFEGLRLDVAAMLAMDRQRVLAALLP
jgi:Uma2 family endonuclease